MTDEPNQTTQGRAAWLVESVSVLVDPVGRMPRAVEATRWVLPLVLTMVMTALASAAVGLRVDASRVVIPKLAEAGELAKASEREVNEQVEQAQRVAIVAGVSKGVFVVPVIALLGAVGVWFCSWLLAGKATFVRSFTVVCLALWPSCCAQAVTLASALRQTSLSPRMARELVPSSLAALVSPPADDASSAPSKPQRPQRAWKVNGPRELLGLVDFFHVWASILVGLGLAAAAGLSRRTAVPAGMIAYFVVLAATAVGLPNLLSSGGPS
jgi:hypothetical protein